MDIIDICEVRKGRGVKRGIATGGKLGRCFLAPVRMRKTFLHLIIEGVFMRECVVPNKTTSGVREVSLPTISSTC